MGPPVRLLALGGLIALVGVSVWLWWGGDAPSPPSERDRRPVRAPEPATPDPATVLPIPAAPFRELVPLSPRQGSVPISQGVRVSVRVTRGSEGLPVPEERVFLTAWGGTDPWLQAREGVTDARGWVQFEGVPSGAVSVAGLRGGTVEGEATLGTEPVLDLIQGVGTDVAGLVLGPDERPVTNARVFMTREGELDEAFPVAETDPQGRFHVAGVDTTRWRAMGARAPGYQPSPLEVLDGLPGRPTALTLRLGPGGAALHGEVVTAAGTPVPWAVVILEHSNRPSAPQRAGFHRNLARVRTQSGLDGGFAFEGVWPTAASQRPGGGGNSVMVRARAPGFAVYEALVPLPEGGRAHHRIVLARGAVVRGIVKDSTGVALPEVTVWSGRAGDPLRAWDRTGPDGAFELLGVGPGDVTLIADGGARGRVHHIRFVGEGGAETWNPVLDTRDSVRGTLLDAEGNPVSGWRVRLACADTTPETQECVTVADGGFWFHGCGGGALQVVTPAPFDVVVIERGWVVPGEAVVLRLRDADRLSASVMGAVVDAGGSPVPDAEVTLVRDGAVLGWSITTDEDGAFQFDAVPFGLYQLRVRSLGFALWRSPWTPHDGVRPWEVGDIHILRGGTVVVRLSDSARREISRAGDVTVSFQRLPDGASETLSLLGSAEPTMALEAGRYRVDIAGGRLAAATREISVLSGRETLLVLDH